MQNIEELAALFKKNGCPDYKWIEPHNIVLAQWVRMKCLFGCPKSGRNASCPPNVPSVSECRQFFNDYSTGVIFHFEKTLEPEEDRRDWGKGINKRLLKLEREVFLSGYQKAFLLFMHYCNMCEECAGVREACKQPRMARPTPEAMGVDVYTTARRYGYPIEVVRDYTDKMNRYAFLLIE
jgi:predicted metal-binding protein